MHNNHRANYRKNRQIKDEDDDEEDIDLENDAANYFRYDPTLSVNTRPKRQRKKGSYKEPDPNNIPVHYIKSKTKKTPSKPITKKKNIQPLKSLDDVLSFSCHDLSTLHMHSLQLTNTCDNAFVY